MLRKIIQLGRETFVVSLPSQWLRQHRLKKGDDVEVEESGPRLLVYPSSEAGRGKVVVDVSGTGHVTKRIVAALYKAGYDEVEIKFESPGEMETVKQTIRNDFVGFEIVRENGKTVCARLVSRPVPEEFNAVLRRVFMLLIEMGNECFKAVNNGNLEDLEAVAGLDEEVNRQVNFCRRMLNVTGHKVVARVAPTYYLVEQLERIGDCYKYLCMLLSKATVIPGTALKDSIAEANLLVRKFHELYYGFSLQGLVQFWGEKELAEKSMAAAFEVAKRGELQAMALIRGIADNLAVANGALLTKEV